MARIRTIKPSFFVNEEVAELGIDTRLFFIALWTIADREGRIEDRPKRIKVLTMPFDTFDTGSALQVLHDAGFITRYEVDGVKYIQINNFLKHQRPNNKEAPSLIPPALEKNGPRTNLDTSEDQSRHTLGREKTHTALLGKGKGNGVRERNTYLHIDTGIDTAPATDTFSDFWNAYPRKVNRAKAEAAWRKVKPDADLVARIMASVEAWKQSPQWTKDGGQYIPYASTWLNGRQWEDELPATTTETQFPWLDEFLAGGDEDGTTPEGPAP